ncbi:MAG: excinuclease ABC subunit UvrC [Lachnospiraceae bacterium]|nr:excinuclease ABC subunit UvrC [Lachnospiraceae bacterium]
MENSDLIKQELKKLPNKPGVYIMRDKNNNIIYVGKAVSLKNRVRQYFQKTNKTIRIQRMVSLIDHFEYIITDNESEALILECNLIKKNRPKFNVLLKDDKTYPYIKIDKSQEYPSIYVTRTILNDGAKYFGPYANAGSAKEMMSFIKEKFKIRQCKKFKSNTRACLNYHIKKCLAPCMGYVSKEEYDEQINQITMLLEGKTDKIIKALDTEIENYSKNLEYEKAAEIRDKKIAIQNISEKQKVSNINENTIDVIGIAKNELLVCIEIFFVRKSKMIGREHYFFDNIADLENKEIMQEFIKQYYLDKLDLPSKIMLKEKILDIEILEKLLSEKANKKVEFKLPQKGEKLKLVEMANKNAKMELENKSKEKEDILIKLKEELGLEKLPRKIEAFDISNISGTNIVAGMCAAIDGVIKKNLTKRFKIKTVLKQDDPKCTEEVLKRRIKHSVEDSDADGFGKLPDVILADGGITEINAIKNALKEYDLNLPVFGMVKNDKHQTRALINENREEIKLSTPVMNFITLFQDEVHRVAIEYHRKLREKEMVKSELDGISGIGEKRKIALLNKFGSVSKIKEAKIEEIMQVKGITKQIAQEILNMEEK